MTVREIQAHLQEMYGAEVSPSLISSVTCVFRRSRAGIPIHAGPPFRFMPGR
jgi:hypothetical protein